MNPLTARVMIPAGGPLAGRNGPCGGTTIAAARGGLPRDNHLRLDIAQYFGLDPYQQFWFSPTDPNLANHVAGLVADMDDYRRIRPHIFPSHAAAIAGMAPWAQRQRNGDVVVWCTIEGFFWFLRTLLGFSRLMLAFYRRPELLHAINNDLLEYNLALLERVFGVCVPTFVTIAEDMSYNQGPMISEQMFASFFAPYYRRLVPRLQERGIPLFVDTDGDVTLLVPWLQDLGVTGVLPLERQAGVDALRLRAQFPRLCMIGHFDKMTMSRGEPAMRAEFERLMPLLKTGGFIPSVDHQTPPDVSLEQYRCYLRLLEEYTRGS